MSGSSRRGRLPSHWPFSLGAYLAVNAVSDALVVVDGPDCVVLKGEAIHGNHDWRSTLLGTPLHPRLVCTGANAETVIFDRTDALLQLLAAAATRPDVGVVLVLGTPISQLTGVQYDLLTRRLAGTTNVPVAEIADPSLDLDWLDGYDEALRALVRAVVRPCAREPGTAAVVGPMVDRMEGDALGNVAEVRRLAEGATDLRVVATWPDGGGAADLARAAAADVVISLPYGRRAARDLATATGATLVEAPLPVGLGATRAFVGTLADALDTRPRADDFAARETDEAVRAVLPFGLRRFRDAFGAWLGDPLLAPGVTEWLADLGCRVDVVGATVRRVRHRVDAEPRGASAWAMRWAPDLDAFCDAVVDSRRHAARFFGVVPDAIDLPGRLAPAPAVLSELGFPSIDAHAVATRPYYGFRGLATLVERLGGLR